MPSYDWRQFAESAWWNRFPEWAFGYAAWRNQASAERIDPGLLDRLIALRGEVRPGYGPQQCPRVFISHRQSDVSIAASVAHLAASRGFQYWLDVEDPLLTALGLVDSDEKALATALVIEFALLNCTHVVAVMTPNTHGSTWVPYEYGRVKMPAAFSTQAACWVHPQLKRSLPEYLHLGPVHRSPAALSAWFVAEMQHWNATVTRCNNKERWNGGPVDPLP